MCLNPSADAEEFLHSIIQVSFPAHGNTAHNHVLFVRNVHHEIEWCLLDWRNVAESEFPENLLKKRLSSDSMLRFHEETWPLFPGFSKNVYGLCHWKPQSLRQIVR